MLFGDKGGPGLFFEDFAPGQRFDLPVPRSITAGDIAQYLALTGDRTPKYCGPDGLVHPLITFHTVFAQTARTISRNAVANLGCARMLWGLPVRIGDTLETSMEIIGLREHSSGTSGVVWVDTVGRNQHGAEVLRFTRWATVAKKHTATTLYRNAPVVPSLPDWVTVDELDVVNELAPTYRQTGSRVRFDAYRIGERIAHVDGMTVTEADDTSLSRLFQNSATPHVQRRATECRPRVHDGVVISLAYALGVHGVENRWGLRAVNGCVHAHPAYAGDTLYAYSEVLDAKPFSRGHGALRLRLICTRNVAPWEQADFTVLREDPERPDGRRYDDRVVLDLDFWEVV